MEQITLEQIMEFLKASQQKMDADKAESMARREADKARSEAERKADKEEMMARMDSNQEKTETSINSLPSSGLILSDYVITGTDPKENNSSFYCCVA
jgi:cell division septum initiation protein DivIVA